MTSEIAPRLLSGLSEIAADYDVLLCDIWGVVHNGQAHHPEACAALKRFRDKGGVVVLVTNAPRPKPPIIEQLQRLRVPAGTYDEIVTSGDVTLNLMVTRGPQPVHHIGPERDLSFFDIMQDQAGWRPELVGLDKAAYVLCTGLFHDDRETPDDYAASLAQMKARGIDMICANPDLVVHVGDTLIYCAGAIAEAYEAIGGRVLQAGKPYAPIYERALELATARLGREPDRKRVLAIGDAMRTDIAGATDFGLDAIFVSNGIHRDELHATSATELDREAYAQFLEKAGARPMAAIPALIW